MKNYNPDIDVLRAIAVIIVIFYHTKIYLFETLISNSGFIGVDIFIVISGFVITRLFFNEKFSYSKFIERRFRRLFPALFLVIISTSIVSYFYLLPHHFVNLGQSIIANIALISNFLFFYQTNYWDHAAFTKPLLHTWTLSLEFQFYFFLIIIFWLFNKQLFKIIFLFFLVSIIALLYADKIYFNLNLREFSLNNYFLIFTRLWEFLTGSLIAIILERKIFFKKIKNLHYFRNVGLLIILISLFVIKSPINYPNLSTLIPVIGTGMILLADGNNNSNIFLKNNILVHIGKISYSLYLWHYPVLIYFFYQNNFELNLFDKVFALFLIYFLSLITYRYVEIPFFRKNIFSQKTFVFLLTIFSIIIFILGLLIIKNIIKPKSYLNYQKIITNFSHLNLSDKIGSERKIKINQFTSSEKIKILICGDSHGADLTEVLQSNNDINNNFEIEFLAFMTCIQGKNSVLKKTNYVFSSIQIEGKNNLSYKNIIKLNKIVLENKKKFVIVGATPEFQTDSDLLLNYLTINKIKKRDLIKNIDKINEFFFRSKKNYINNVNNKLLNLSKELNAEFLDKFNYMCEKEKKICFGVDLNGNKNFIDYSHLSKNGKKFFGNRIQETNWLKLN